MHTVHFDLSGEKFHQLKWKALIKTFSRLGEYWWLSLLLSNFPGFEIEILSEQLTLALMTGDHWGLTLVTGGVQLKSIVRSHSHKPHWKVIRDLYIINSSQSVSPTIRTLHIPPGERVNITAWTEFVFSISFQVKIFKFSFLSESRRGRTISSG